MFELIFFTCEKTNVQPGAILVQFFIRQTNAYFFNFSFQHPEFFTRYIYPFFILENFQMNNDSEGTRWIHRYLANTIRKTYQCTLPSSQKVEYVEEMSEIKLCPSCAVQYIQLCKADDARKLAKISSKVLVKSWV